MKRLLFFLLCCPLFGRVTGQTNERPLSYYQQAAKANSPLIKDYRNRMTIGLYETERLKALYTHSRLELNGDYLFVPIVATDGGGAAFKWNAQDGTDYYGYDLSESSGHLHVGATWTQPLLGGAAYKTAQAQAAIETDMNRNHIRMESHQLERTVTERYLLCLLDKTQTDFADTIGALLNEQIRVIGRMVKNGFAKQSDLRLLNAEKTANDELRAASRQSYQSHLSDLNVLCGIDDTTLVTLLRPQLSVKAGPSDGKASLFTEQFRLDSLNTAASLHSFNMQYKPRLDLFVNGGLQTGAFRSLQRRLGWSAGLTFSWTLPDSRQQRYKEQQAEWQWNTIRTYRDRAELQRQLRIRQCLAELDKYDKRLTLLRKQMAEYAKVLADYDKEMKVGQVSIPDYLTVLRNKVQTEKDLLLTQTNRLLVITACNYWNW